TILKLNASTFALLAFVLCRNAAAQGSINHPIFSCTAPNFGGCCEKFLTTGSTSGVGCKILNNSDKEEIILAARKVPTSGFRLAATLFILML
ncbi:hypothetical protein LSUE1_G002435, partial [Lachnellula suecica]